MDDHRLKSKLPLPSKIASFEGINFNEESNVSPNDGRIRSYPHERGQWSTHVYIKVENESLTQLLSDLSADKKLENINFHKEMHMTIVRGHYVMRYHQIEPFCLSLKSKLRSHFPFIVCLNRFNIFNNDECTRSFLTFSEISYDNDQSLKTPSSMLTDAVRSVLSDFGCDMIVPNEANSMHCSLAWTLPQFRGDLEHLKTQCEEYLDEPIMVHVNEIEAKIGNLYKKFKL